MVNSVINELNVKPFWDAGLKGKGVVVAVIDRGFNEHDELEGQALEIFRMTTLDSDDTSDPEGHGTPVASIIAGHNVGIAPESKLLLIRTNDEGIVGNRITNLVRAIRYAVDWEGANGEKVSIINMSIGTGNNISAPTIQSAVNYAVENNVLVIAAAGNLRNSASYPAAFENVVSVGSYLRNPIRVSPDSSSRSNVNLIAPTNIRAANASGGYRTFDGTSAATPCVTGVAALLRQKLTREMGRYPTAVELREELMRHVTMDGITGSKDSNLIGRGRLRLTYEEKDKPRDENIDINVAIDGIVAAGIFDSADYWKGIMAYIDGLTPDHPEYYRFRYVQLAFKKFYNYIS